MTCDLSQRILSESVHNACHGIHSTQSREFEAVYFVQVTTVFFVNLFQSCLQRTSGTSVVSSHLTDQHRSDNGIFVTNIRTSQIAVALFKTEDETVNFTCCFQLCNLITDPFETGQNASQFYTIMFCNCICQRCGYDRFYCYRVLWHRTFFDTSCTDIIQKQNTNFISTDQFIRTIRALHSDTDTVCIRVGCEHQVCAGFFCKIQSQFQCCKNFRVRITAGCKVTVWIFLFRNNSNIGNSDVFEYLCNRNQTGTI